MAWEREIAKIKRTLATPNRSLPSLLVPLTESKFATDANLQSQNQNDSLSLLTRKSRLSNHTTRLNLATTTTTNYNSSEFCSLSLSLSLVHGTFLTEDRMAETDRKTAPHRLIIREHIPSPLFRFQHSAPTFVPP